MFASLSACGRAVQFIRPEILRSMEMIMERICHFKDKFSGKKFKCAGETLISIMEKEKLWGFIPRYLKVKTEWR